MGLLTFALNVTLDGCCDHREGVADDEMLRYWTRVMDAAGAMLFGRRTYELMEDALYPQKQTLVERVGVSALCQKRTFAANENFQNADVAE